MTDQELASKFLDLLLRDYRVPYSADSTLTRVFISLKVSQVLQALRLIGRCANVNPDDVYNNALRRYAGWLID
jgi:hypothetical protein